MNFSDSSQLYFLGIGGTAMGNVALACAASGNAVSGSDEAVYPPMSEILRGSGIDYYEGYSEKHLENKGNATIVVGNAISRGNAELEYALDNRLPMISMPELLGRMLIGRNTSVVITGTHGKTSVASLTAWLLEQAGAAPGFLIGGVPGNFSTGCRPAAVENGVFVSEGDEYDSSFFDKRSKFLHYRPDVAVINNIEFDHADIFDSIDDITKTFRLFARLVPRRGTLLVNAASPLCREVAAAALTNVETFGTESGAVWRAVELDYAHDGTEFTLLRHNAETGRMTTPLYGEMNVRNAVAAVAAAISTVEQTYGYRGEAAVQAMTERIISGFDGFKLPKRRLEILGQWRGATVVDDFAHHPTAIAQTMIAARQKFPGRRLIACFEPRSNTTTRQIFQGELAECFDGAAAVIIGPTNRPERYAEDKRLNLGMLQQDIEYRGIPAFILPTTAAQTSDWGKDVAAILAGIVQGNDVILLFSNGNFGGLRGNLV